MTAPKKVVYLSGGVGGARLLSGLARCLPPQDLCVVVNTGDDFVHWGLNISPDLDTVLYTLSGLGDAERGWGLRGETFAALSGMQQYGAPTWFALGDRDLATHLLRTQALRAGQTLTEVTTLLAKALGVGAQILPMCDEPRPTLVDTHDHDTLPFQSWLVEHRAPSVRGIRFSGGGRASHAVLAALDCAELVVIGPSNPYVSIDPILTLEGVRERVAAKRVVAVSPIVHGAAVKGPLAHMIRTLSGREPSPTAVAAHYDGLLHGMVIEQGDTLLPAGLSRLETQTVMRSEQDRLRLAREVLQFARGDA